MWFVVLQGADRLKGWALTLAHGGALAMSYSPLDFPLTPCKRRQDADARICLKTLLCTKSSLVCQAFLCGGQDLEMTKVPKTWKVVGGPWGVTLKSNAGELGQEYVRLT